MRIPVFVTLLLLPVCWAEARVDAFAKLPIHFEANHGQFAPAVRFATAGLQVSPAEARLLLAESGEATLRMRIDGGDPAAAMEGLDRLPGESNYLLGNDPQRWQTHVPHFARVRAAGVYRGIDVVYYGKGRQLEFDFEVAPGADPRVIRLRFDGAEPRLAASGDLLLGPVRLQKPVIYQGRNIIAGGFTVDADGGVGFAIGAYDRRRLLVIDPVLSYSTLFNATSAVGAGVAVDGAGNTYVTGNTSNGFLTVNGLQPAFGAGRAAYVAKFNAAGTVLLYSTFLGGSTTESGGAPTNSGLRVAVDRAGSAYVVGTTNSNSYPVSAGTVQPLNRGGVDLFVSKLNPAGSALVYSTYLGGAQDENPLTGLVDIAVDGTGSAYVAGGTASRNFPVTAGALQAAYGGGASDGFVARIDPIGSTLVYSTYLGAAGADTVNAVAIDGAGSAYVAGSVSAGAFGRPYGGGESDAFVAKLNASGSALLYAALLGGTGGDTAFGVAVDGAGSAYTTGVTVSPNFPVTAQAFQKTLGAGGDAFVAKFNAAGTALVYSTFLGGGRDDIAYAIAVDGQGAATIVGGTESTNFPVSADAFQAGLGLVRKGGGRTGSAAFLARLNPAGAGLTYATYFGGSSNDAATSLALDGAGNVTFTGAATSMNFPRTLANYEPPDRTAVFTAFLAKFDFVARNSMALGSVISAASYQTGTLGVVAPGQIVTLFGNELGPAQLTTLRLTADGRVDTTLAGVRVLFDGVPAPLLYVSAKQLSAVVPYAVAPNGRTVVQVDYQGQRSNPLVLWVQPALVGVFTQNASGRGAGAILNQDGTVNSPANPAEKGSVVVLFGTGEGRTQPEGVDGKVAVEPLPRPVLRIFAQVADRATEVLYVGAAPGLVAGVLQMNIKVPETSPSGPNVPIFIGGMDGPFGVEASERVTIAIR